MSFERIASNPYDKIGNVVGILEGLKKSIVSNIDNPQYLAQIKASFEKEKEANQKNQKLSPRVQKIVKLLQDNPEVESMVLSLTKTYINQLKPKKGK